MTSEEPENLLTTTIQLKLLPTREQRTLIHRTMDTYIATVNDIVADFRSMDKTDNRTSKDVATVLPSCLKNQCIKDAKSIFRKYRKACRKAAAWNKMHPDEPKTATCPVVRKQASIWNNQNYTIKADRIGFPVFQSGKSTKIWVRAIIPSEQMELLSVCKNGTLRITPKGDKLIAQIAIEHPKPKPSGDGVMGVDLGLKIPAVCVTDAGKVLCWQWPKKQVPETKVSLRPQTPWQSQKAECHPQKPE